MNTREIKFHHKHDPRCVYTRDIEGVVHWEAYEQTGTDELGPAGSDDTYTNFATHEYLEDGTWVLLEDK